MKIPHVPEENWKGHTKLMSGGFQGMSYNKNARLNFSSQVIFFPQSRPVPGWLKMWPYELFLWLTESQTFATGPRHWAQQFFYCSFSCKMNCHTLTLLLNTLTLLPTSTHSPKPQQTEDYTCYFTSVERQIHWHMANTKVTNHVSAL